jgi:hypothetical protein
MGKASYTFCLTLLTKKHHTSDCFHGQETVLYYWNEVLMVGICASFDHMVRERFGVGKGGEDLFVLPSGDT